ncbi:CBS domain-containing protein [Bacteriovorax stolpii]|uniref:CBS domain-containing protein n=1 Tax=Bacteriovorax stolpii TaxID=960 RepID=UPI00163BD62B|nr:CBS domain-containing protein [Bacteriovorax stolpii]
MNAQSIMSKDLITINNDVPIIDAYRLMKEKDIRHLPVVDHNQRIIGILSDRDVQKAMVAKKLDEYYCETPTDNKVSSFMNSPVYMVNEKTDLKAVAKIMIREKISSLIVENDEHDITGIVTTTDMLAYILQTLEKMDHNPNWTQWTMSYYLNSHKK